MIDRLSAVLRQAGLEPTAREIADVLWLAARMGPVLSPSAPTAEGESPVAEPERAPGAFDAELKGPTEAP
ncbi:hypothetical protein BE17_43145, partial [Sorangium cellulosum]